MYNLPPHFGEEPEIIEESWAREKPLPPYYVYLKMAYHLSQEARTGLSEFRFPRDFDQKLFEFQTAAVKIAAHHLNKRGLMRDYKRNSRLVTRRIHSRAAVVEKEYFEISKSKSVIDSIDCELARHLGFTDEELDFILNYDIKYRMGQEAGEDEE